MWTIQPLPVWERLQKERVLYTDILLSPNLYLRDSYEWMRQQMEKRLPTYEGHYPWWGYYRPKPDLRKLRFDWRSPGEKVSEIRRYMRLELLLEQAVVLLHNRNAWDMSLIPGPVLYDESEEPAYWNLSDSDQERFIHDTRERLFDIEGLRQGTIYTEDCSEVVFERLDLADVVRSREFLRHF